MEKSLLRIVCIACLVAIWVGAAAWALPPPEEGETLRDFRIAMPKSAEDRDYLGLSGAGRSFRIPELKARIVIIQIFSMYCPYCQDEAPNVNRLYERIEANPALKGKIKVLGIGAGNSPFEVGVYKKKYAIPFPLFPDKDFAIYDQVGEVRTPFFIAMKINADGTHRIIYSRVGALGNVDRFLDTLTRMADLTPGGNP